MPIVLPIVLPIELHIGLPIAYCIPYWISLASQVFDAETVSVLDVAPLLLIQLQGLAALGLVAAIIRKTLLVHSDNSWINTLILNINSQTPTHNSANASHTHDQGSWLPAQLTNYLAW